MTAASARPAPPHVDPCSAQAPLAFVFSPLVGTPLTTSAKFAVVAKSPLTGMLNDALASSQFAISGKLTGHDAIVLTGRAATPSVLLVDGRTPRLVAAGDTWGLPAAQAEEALKRRLGRGWADRRDRTGRGAGRALRDDLAPRASRRPRGRGGSAGDRHAAPGAGLNGGQAEPLFGASAPLSVLTRADGYLVVPEPATGLDAGAEVWITLYR